MLSPFWTTGTRKNAFGVYSDSEKWLCDPYAMYSDWAEVYLPLNNVYIVAHKRKDKHPVMIKALYDTCIY